MEEHIIDMNEKNTLAMKLLHYFITEKGYTPIILQGAEDEIWLENLDEDYKGYLTIESKYVGIKELDLSCELFYIWFKAALMQYIGAMKKQLDLTGVGLPFDINADGLLERGRQLMDKVEELKGTKSHWSNF